MIPVDFKRMVREKVVEGERLEFKRGWNPEPILHTIVAFANDIDNLGGGYILIGVEESKGMPLGDVVGIDRSSVDRINKDLLNLCNQIEPRYIPETDTFDHEGKTVMVIWAPGGSARPYKCPNSLSKRNESKSYYIRRMGSTIRASPTEERELFEVSNDTPFDDRCNDRAAMSDIKPSLVENYLSTVGSDLMKLVYGLPIGEVADRMHITGGPPENRRPLNVGLMFFNDRPDDFFREARIDVVIKPDPTGEGMKEKIFRGPLDRQLRDSLMYIGNMIVEERVSKHEDRAEATRIFNYPMQAVEEAISNAVYHKSYQIPEPITVVVMPDRMEITSAPGPDRSITDEDLGNRRLVSRRYRNRRIGDYLREMDLAEGRNTGVPTMVASMVSNGSDLPVFKTDAERTYLTVVLPIHGSFLRDTVPQPVTGNGRRTRAEIITEVLGLLSRNGEMSIREISDAMGYKSPPTSLKSAVSTLISEGSLEYTDRERNSPKQKIRLAGR
ncbi:MAG: putative DNA binding domain-containing protein [Candidatus Methanomethylophilaceae archaeon]|nr:putative DNA binding domain-containing protein [Candidatus Methanomethylophilaceae archaeon]